jgi:ribosomal protein S12 methylthiotransferase
MRVQATISRRKNKGTIGQVVPVLVEGAGAEGGGWGAGRAASMAPEVDGQVLIRGGDAEVGRIVPVRITGAGTYDLVGERA